MNNKIINFTLRGTCLWNLDDSYQLINISYRHCPGRYLQKGWPFIIKGSEEWHFIYDAKYIKDSIDGTSYKSTIAVIKDAHLKPDNVIIPLNQFEDGFTNEEILEYESQGT